MTKRTIALIQGDPAGIGPELLIRLLSDDEVEAPLACTALPNAGASGKTLMFCIGQSPGDPEDPYTLVMVSQPDNEDPNSFNPDGG